MGREREPLPTHVRDTPALPPAYHDALDRGLRELGLELSSRSRTAIDGHARLLLAWTKAINLTAIREPARVALDHVVDSLAAMTWLGAHSPDALLDLGSGGGYPGVPLAAASPGMPVTLLESVTKKARFLATVVDATGLGETAEVVAERAETLAADPARRARWPVVTARAVAATADLVELAFPLLAPGGALIAWKRGELGTELGAAKRAIAALGGGTLERFPVDVPGLDGHVLVVATRLGQVPAIYPRDPAMRRRQPW